MFFLVDFENVRDVNFALLPPECCVKVFVGKSQNSIPFSLTTAAQRLGERLEWVKIEGDGHNNLDFHLAFYLGQLARKFPEEDFVIVFKDKGFDALIGHLIKRNVKCVRVNSILDSPKLATTQADLNLDTPLPAARSAELNFKRICEVLRKLNKKGRPTKRTALTKFTAAIFQ